MIIRDTNITDWLLEGDEPALVYQVSRDLLDLPAKRLEALRKRIPAGPWAGRLLERRRPDGHWGNGCYNPKWTCTHYVLFELLQTGLSGDNAACRASVGLLLNSPQGVDGGVNYARTVAYSDVCVNGVVLNLAAYFGVEDGRVDSLVDYLLQVRMADGGWNCEYYREARRSSLHTTISVAEGLAGYLAAGRAYRAAELRQALADGVEFILRHELFKSMTSGEIISDQFFKFAFPVRWKYDILRCLDFFRACRLPFDQRMDDALDCLAAKRSADGRWKAAAQAGKTFLTLEPNGKAGRWNTLRARRVFRWLDRTRALA